MTKEIIEAGYEELSKSIDISENLELADAVNNTLEELDKGKIRVAEKINSEWIVNDWIKKAILIYFSFSKNSIIKGAESDFFDKVPLKYTNLSETDALKNKVRIVPSATARYGSYQAPGVILMPSYVNIGAYVDRYTMVDTWVTVGSCAQIGKNVHLSGGVGIGGVLEPAGAMPVVVEDGAFIGSRSIIVEGVRIKKGAVIGANVTLTASTPIIDVTGKEPVEVKGVVDENSVVIPGTRPKEFPSGVFNTPCALVIGKRKESTDEKTSLTDALRTFGVEV